ncbi:mannose-1-phosphate guanylyltransferase/mannose-6-phosphate isomerase [Desulfonatronospira thiodismutans ASO3-1]|uniref:mannose-1-phosphate guanylyltransferase n=1 Tax=Desulfonatronospira thiodismutans ASO3-1 TaxID=555779 RepID=D6SSQ9_9BACT|nr:mannose-1-phosphate guanylyltransferase/mannose-6-phosphate isomerase [Desulfonatronospira thiodismutans]EFI33725.1 mannose-1-phosphate guanylyltransferase/mannose-6-phosphate isomerase [Desulfonatronospira thiodismutans ASO3-1]
MFLPVILAGGSGTRLWPLSRKLYPKQFLAFGGELSMLQQSVRRLDGLQCAPPLLVCNEEHRFLAAEQMRLMGHEDVSILLEPEGRNTAPAIALAALHATSSGEDPVLFVMAADHHIHDQQAFQESVTMAAEQAGKDWLVTFGIVPDSPETGYGYIRRGENIQGQVYRAGRFVEKPDSDTAAAYLKAGDYYWNSGMFMFRAGRYLEELEKFEPAILECCRAAMQNARRDMHFVRVDKDAFNSCPGNSIDYAVMEKTQDAALVPMEAGWSDVGSWSSLWDLLPRDAEGNSCKGDVMAMDTSNSLLFSDYRMVATLGVQDLVVVETKDAVLVAHKNRAQDIKSLVDRIKSSGRSEHVTHREVFRPWGSYDGIDAGGRYQVKRITVKPGAKLSLQKHHHRAEHWVVVSGTAMVTNGEESFLVTENQSTYIPLGRQHSLENPGKIPLELIEVQSGAYLGEDDIVRFEDIYGRL